MKCRADDFFHIDRIFNLVIIGWNLIKKSIVFLARLDTY